MGLMTAAGAGVQLHPGMVVSPTESIVSSVVINTSSRKDSDRDCWDVKIPVLGHTFDDIEALSPSKSVGRGSRSGCSGVVNFSFDNASSDSAADKSLLCAASSPSSSNNLKSISKCSSWSTFTKIISMTFGAANCEDGDEDLGTAIESPDHSCDDLKNCDELLTDATAMISSCWKGYVTRRKYQALKDTDDIKKAKVFYRMKGYRLSQFSLERFVAKFPDSQCLFMENESLGIVWSAYDFNDMYRFRAGNGKKRVQVRVVDVASFIASGLHFDPYGSSLVSNGKGRKSCDDFDDFDSIDGLSSEE